MLEAFIGAFLGAAFSAVLTWAFLVMSRLGALVDHYYRISFMLSSFASELRVEIQNCDLLISKDLAVECSKVIYLFPEDSGYQNQYRTLLRILRYWINSKYFEGNEGFLVDSPLEADRLKKVEEHIEEIEEVKRWMRDCGDASIGGFWRLALRKELGWRLW